MHVTAQTSAFNNIRAFNNLCAGLFPFLISATISHPCPYCGGRLRIIEAFAGLPAAPSNIGDNRRHQNRHLVTTAMRLRRRRADLPSSSSSTGLR
jgi:hypothetical protein